MANTLSVASQSGGILVTLCKITLINPTLSSFTLTRAYRNKITVYLTKHFTKPKKKKKDREKNVGL